MTMSKIIRIENINIGDKNRVFTIAEIGSNHNRSKKTVKDLIRYSAKAGFDAVKFQIYDAEEAFSKNETTKNVKLSHLYGNKPWWEIAKNKILMPREWFGEMFDYVRKFKMIPLSAIHREEDILFLRQFGLSAIKIASIDLNYYQLHEKLIKYKLPTIISTGMGNIEEIKKTIKFYKNKKHNKIILLHCNSLYPPKNNQINLNNIRFFKEKLNVISGFSDHTNDNYCAFASVVLGAKVIEKHVTLNKKANGPDHHFAIEPNEMKDFIYGIRKIESSLGSYQRNLSTEELKSRKMIRRSIVARRNIKKGEKISIDKIKFARPGTGISTELFFKVSKFKAKKNISAETLISWKMLTK